jgi:hypothetical protein
MFQVHEEVIATRVELERLRVLKQAQPLERARAKAIEDQIHVQETMLDAFEEQLIRAKEALIDHFRSGGGRRLSI